jgi:dihydropteroate synthase
MVPLAWQLPTQLIEIGRRPLVMGIVNVTPDSFSDGGLYSHLPQAVDHAMRLVAEGADILDIGGESTRPGAVPVPLEEELNRVVPVVQKLATRTNVPISVDTMKAEVAKQCLLAGAVIVNDVSGLRDPQMIRVVTEYRAGVIVMHMPGTPQTMNDNPQYGDILRDLSEYFEDRLRVLTASGIALQAISLDPGIGFGKRTVHNLELLANLDVFAKFGRPLCLGVSRKGFIGNLCGRQQGERLAGSLAVACIAAARGQAQILRVHDVAATRDAVVMLDEIDRYRR